MYSEPEEGALVGLCRYIVSIAWSLKLELELELCDDGYVDTYHDNIVRVLRLLYGSIRSGLEGPWKMQVSQFEVYRAVGVPLHT